MRSGAPDIGAGFTKFAGILSNYWSRSSVAKTTTFQLHFDGSEVHPSNGPIARSAGFSLRCLQK